MADPEPKVLKEGEVAVPQSLLETIQKQLADAEIAAVERDGKIAGLEAMIEGEKGASTIGEPKLREKKSFEPKFRTVRLRQYPMGGGPEKGFVVGWTSKGSYQEVDRTGVSPQIVDYIDVIFAGHERSKDGKLQAEKIKLLDLLNKGEQVVCKIEGVKRVDNKEPTGEEINVTVFDPQHGLVSTGDTIDGYVVTSDIKVTVRIPGIDQPVEVDATYAN